MRGHEQLRGGGDWERGREVGLVGVAGAVFALGLGRRHSGRREPGREGRRKSMHGEGEGGAGGMRTTRGQEQLRGKGREVGLVGVVYLRG